jgi:hypothetical protein
MRGGSSSGARIVGAHPSDALAADAMPLGAQLGAHARAAVPLAAGAPRPVARASRSGNAEGAAHDATVYAPTWAAMAAEVRRGHFGSLAPSRRSVARGRVNTARSSVVSGPCGLGCSSTAACSTPRAQAGLSQVECSRDAHLHHDGRGMGGTHGIGQVQSASAERAPTTMRALRRCPTTMRDDAPDEDAPDDDAPTTDDAPSIDDAPSPTTMGPTMTGSSMGRTTRRRHVRPASVNARDRRRCSQRSMRTTTNANDDECDLRRCDLRRCDLRRCDLRRCDLRRCDLRRCDLRRCDQRSMRPTTMRPTTCWPITTQPLVLEHPRTREFFTRHEAVLAPADPHEPRPRLEHREWYVVLGNVPSRQAVLG